jgi:hypothetical protein
MPCEPGDLPAIKLKDKDDLGILSAAVGGGLNVIVTGDKEMQMVGMVAGLIKGRIFVLTRAPPLLNPLPQDWGRGLRRGGRSRSILFRDD